MKVLSLLLLVFVTNLAAAQIKFSEKTFDNGMLYPEAHFDKNPTVADSMNAAIQRNLLDAEVSDFCIGDYGYFQKGNHIELHLVCNCIDFEATEHRFLFFSLETGTLVDYTDLFNSKDKEKTLAVINSKVRKSLSAGNCSTSFGPMESDLKWEEITVRLYKDGIEIHPISGTCETPVQIPWTELSSFLKFSFL